MKRAVAEVDDEFDEWLTSQGALTAGPTPPPTGMHQSANVCRHKVKEATPRGTTSLRLEADLHDVVRWADSHRQRWSFTLSNAGANYTEFGANLEQLDEINWGAVNARDWRDSDLREGKQAEFLLHESCRFELITRIGVICDALRARVLKILKGTRYAPTVEVVRSWYY